MRLGFKKFDYVVISPQSKKVNVCGAYVIDAPLDREFLKKHHLGTVMKNDVVFVLKRMKSEAHDFGQDKLYKLMHPAYGICLVHLNIEDNILLIT